MERKRIHQLQLKGTAGRGGRHGRFSNKANNVEAFTPIEVKKSAGIGQPTGGLERVGQSHVTQSESRKAVLLGVGMSHPVTSNHYYGSSEATLDV